MSALPVALQLYTVRDQTEKDFIGTLREVARMGYAGVQLDGSEKLGGRELRAVLDDLGLEAVGQHIGTDAIEADLQAVIEFNQAVGSRYVVCPWVSETEFASPAAVQALAARLSHIGAACRQAGLQFLYHNHAHEFVRFGERFALDELYALADAAVLQAELDVYWIQYAGQDPVTYIRRYGGRLPLLHLKDMDPTDRSFTEVGAGLLDLAAIAKAAEDADVLWNVVEQDVCKRPSLESARLSLENLRARGLA